MDSLPPPSQESAAPSSSSSEPESPPQARATADVSDVVLQVASARRGDPGPSYDFSKYLKPSSARTRNAGVTARVTKVMEWAHSALRNGEGNKTIDLSERERWQIDRLELEDKIAKLQADKDEKTKSAGEVRYVSLSRPAAPDGVLEEVALLREENFRLRNLALDDPAREAHVITKLRREVEELKSENHVLRRQTAALRDNDLLSSRPPVDLDLASVQNRVPLAIDQIEKQRVMDALEAEWRTSCESSRHGFAQPLRNPFDRRRFDHQPF